jgi:glycosyltransferase involved in cell wall biosynthesis
MAADAMFYLRYYLFAANLFDVPMDIIPDVVHSHDLYTLPAAIGLARRHGAKVIWDAHELETERAPPLPGERKAFIDHLERHLFDSVDEICTVCDSVADFYAARFPKRRPFVVMNSPEVSQLGHTGNDIRTATGVGAAPIAVYTGIVGREGRGLHVMCEAMRFLPEWHLVVLGPRHPGNDEWLLGHAAQQGVESRVHLLPPVPHEQVVESIRSATVGVCPIQPITLSYRFAAPNKLFEMAFAGLPLVVSNLPEMERIVRTIQIGVVFEHPSATSLAAAIRTAAADRPLYELDEPRKALLDSLYSWDVQKARLYEAYQRLLNPGD